MSFEQTELTRLLNNLVRIGTVAELDAKRVRVRVQIAEDLVTAWLPWLSARAGADRTWWAPSIGEQVLLLSPSGALEQAVVIGSLYQSAKQDFGPPADSPGVHRTVYSDGTAVTYDSESKHLSVELAGDAEVTLVGDNKLTIKGDLHVSGNLKAEGDVADGKASMADDRSVYNSHTHPTCPQGPVSRPTQQQ